MSEPSSEHPRSLRGLTEQSIEGQDPNWKNVLSRSFIQFEDWREKKFEGLEEEGGFWYSKAGRRVVDGAAFFSGYLFFDKRGV